MIFDNITNVCVYHFDDDISTMLSEIKKFVDNPYQTELVKLENGAYFMVNDFETQVTDISVMEAHKNHIDVMFILEGKEAIRVKRADLLTNITFEYSEEKDYLLSEESDRAEETCAVLGKGDFIILYPQDAHCTCCAVDKTPLPIKKIVGKVKINK